MKTKQRHQRRVFLEALEDRRLLALIASDGFEDYTAGAQLESSAGVGLNGGTGWTEAWNVADASRTGVTVVSGGLSYAGGGLSIQGGTQAMQYVATETSVTQFISRAIPAESGTVYLSFLYNNTVNADGTDDFLQVGFDSGALPNPRVSAIDENNLFTARSGTSTSGASNISSTTNTTYLLVLKAEKVSTSTTYNRVSLFVNPTTTSEPVTPSAVTTTNGGLGSAAFLAFRKARLEIGDTFLFDELRVGTSYADVVNNTSVQLDGANLTISDINSTGLDNQFSVSRSGNILSVSDTNHGFRSPPAGGTLSADNKTVMFDLSVTTINTITVNSSGGNDTVAISEFDGTAVGVTDLTINTGAGTDTVNINGAITVSGAVNVTTVNVNSLAAATVSTGTGLTITNTGTSSTLAGVISGSGAPLTKSGPGTVTLTNANTYSGATAVNGGTLLVDGSLAAASAVMVTSGTTLGGTGTVNGPISVATGGILAPGTSPGTLNVAGVTFTSGSNYNVEITGNSAALYDRLNNTGTVALGAGDATLNLSGAYLPVPGDWFTIVQGTVTGQFAGLPDGSLLFFNGQPLTIVYSSAVLAFDATPTIEGTAGSDGFEISLDASGNVVVTNGAVTIMTAPLANLTSLTINGGDGDDTLTIDYTGPGGEFALPITFNGQNQASPNPGDALAIVGGAFATATFNYINANNGSINLDGTMITYTGLEPLAFSGTADNMIFNLPVTHDQAVLEDDGTASNGMSRLRSANSTFEVTTFANPGVSLTINAGNGNDTISIAVDFDSGTGAGEFAASLVINGDVGTDIVRLLSVLGLGSATAAGNLTITAEDIVLAANISTDGSVATAAGNVQLNGRIYQDASLTIDTDGPAGDGSIVFNGPLFATDSASNSLNLNAGTLGDIDFLGTVSGTTFVEAGGVISGEAERYTNRSILSSGGVWKIAPTEVLPGDGAVSIANPTGGQFMQALPDSTSVGGASASGLQRTNPGLLYRMNITTPGVYRLFLRSETDTPTGNADSIYVDLVEFMNGAGGVADWYATPTASADQNFNSGNIWQGSGAFEATAPSTATPMTWNITTPGIYTLRIVPREDGAAVDKFIFQHTSVALPTGAGTAESMVVGPNLNIISAHDVTANSSIAAQSVIQAAGTGTTMLSGLVAASGAAGIDLTGTNFTITGGLSATNGPISIDHSGANSLDINTGAITTGAAGLTVSSATASTTGAIFSTISGTGGVTKDGPGALILSGNNDYTGTTTVSAGTLLVSGSTDAASAVTVAGGATLGGNGIVNGSVDAAETGISTLAPGANGVGKLTLGSTITFDSDAVFVVDINGSGIAGTDYDQLVVNGVATLANAPLVLNTTAAPTTGSTLTILDATSITGRFTHNGRVLEEGDTFHEDGVNYTISYVGGDVTLTEAGATPGINGTTGIDAFTIRKNGTNIAVLLGGTVVYAAPSPTNLFINGLAEADTLTVDYAFGGNFTTPISFDGGDPVVAPGDKLVINGGTFATAIFNFTDGNSGNVDLGGGQVISYAGLEPVDMTGSTITSLVFNLPDTDELVDDISTLGISGSDFVLTSTNGEHELTTVSTAGVISLAINGRQGDDSITVLASFSTYTGSLAIDGGLQNDTIVIDAALNLGDGAGASTGALSLTANTVDINAAISTANEGATGTITLGGDTVRTTSNISTDGAAVSIAATTGFILDGTVTIATELGGNNNAGSVSLTGPVSGNAAGRDLIISTNVIGAVAFNGGAVSLPVFGSAGGGSFINDLTINTSGGTAGGIAGVLTLTGNVTLASSNGSGDPAVFTYRGSDVAIANSLTIDTENGANGIPGTVDFGTNSNVFASAAGATLTINVNSGGGPGGNIIVGTIDNNGGANNFLGGLTVNTAGTSSQSGEMRLYGDVLVDGAISLSRRTVSMLSGLIRIDSKQSATGPGNPITLGGAGYAQVSGADFTVDSSTSAAGQNGGTLTIADAGLDTAGYPGQFLNDVTFITSGGIGGAAGTTTFQHQAINLNDNGVSDPASLAVIGGGNIIFSASGFTAIVIDTQSGTDGPGGSVDFGTSVISSSGSVRDLSINTSAGSGSGLNGGSVVLGTISNSGGGQFFNDITITSSGDGAGAAGTVTLGGNISLDNNGTGDPASFTVTGGGNIILGVAAASTITIDIESGNSTGVTDVGGVNFGTSAVSATNVNVNLAIDTSNVGTSSVGGNVTLAGFNSAGGNLVNDLTITADANGTRGDVSFTTAAVNLASGLNVAIADEISQSAAAPITTVSSVSMTARNTVSLNANVNAGASTISISANQDGAGSEGFTQASGTSIVTTNATATALVVRVNTAAGGTGGAALGLLEVGAAPGQITVNTTSTAGSGGAIIDNNAGVLNLSGGDAALLASGGIGSADAIEMNLTNVGFNNSTAGDVRLTELVGTGGFVVNAVVGVATSANTGGAAFLIASSPITFAVNTSATNITAQALESAATNTDNITVNSGVTVTATTGNVLFEAGDRIVIQSTGLVTATLGNVTFDSGFSDTDNDGLMDLSGGVSAVAGTVTLDLNAEAGPTSNATQTATSTITSVTLSLLTTGGGTGVFDLDAPTTNNVSNLIANVGGEVEYRDANSLTLGTGGNGITTSNDDATICVIAGNLTLSDNVNLGSGTLRLQTDAVGSGISQSAGTITASALGLRSGTGGINLPTATNDVDTLAGTTTGSFTFQDADGFTIGTVGIDGCFTPGVTGTSSGDLELCVLTGDITISDNIAAGGNTVRLQASTGNVVETLAATITAGTLGVRAGGGNVTLDNSNDVDNLAAFASGNVSVVNVGGVIIGTVGAGPCFTATTGVSTTAGTISVINNTSGNITISQAVSAGGANSVTLDANGATADLLVNASVNSAGGAISLTADNDVSFNATGDVASNNGAITITGDAGVPVGGAVTMDPDTAIDSGTGTIHVSATGNITLGDLTTTNATLLAVTITSTAGGVVDAGADVDTEITANAAGSRVTIIAATGIGATNAIETEVASLDASVTAAGNILIVEVSSIDLFDIDTAAGSITIQSGGTMTATDVQSNTDSDTNDITLTTTAGGIGVGTIAAGVAGDVFLTAATAITDLDATNPDITADDLVLLSTTGVGTLADPLETVSSNLEAVGGTGGVFIANSGDLTVGGIDALVIGVSATGTGIAISTIGNLDVSEDVIASGAAADVMLSTVDQLALTQNLTVNSGVTVQSTGGSVTLNAGDALEVEAGGSVSAGTFLTLNVDQGGVDPLNGATVNLFGSLTAANGDVTVNTGNEADTVTVSGTVSALAGNIVVNLGTGNDVFTSATNGTTVINAGAGTFTINAGDGNDTITTGDATFAAAITASLTNLNGNDGTNPLSDGNDTFNVRPLSTTPFAVRGERPHLVPVGDTLNLDFSTIGMTIPTLTVGAVNGGGWSFTPSMLLPVNYSSIEKVVTTPAASVYNLIILMDDTLQPLADRLKNSINGAADDVIDVQRIGPTDLQVEVNGEQVFRGADAAIRTLQILGSNDQGDTLRVNEDAMLGLPLFAGVLGATAVAGGHVSPTFTNLTSLAAVPFHFDGGNNSAGGPDAAELYLVASHAVVSTSDNLDSTHSGNIGVGAGPLAFGTPRFALSFENVEPILFVGAGGSLTSDASSSPDSDVTSLTISDAGSTSLIAANLGSLTYAPTTFSGFNSLVVRSGGGADTIDLVAIDTTPANGVVLDTSVLLDADNQLSTDLSADNIIVRSLPALSGVATLLGGQGSDTFRLTDDLDDIAGPVEVDGEGLNVANNNDQLFLNDSGDMTADPNVLITAVVDTADYVVTGVNASGVTFRNIDSFDYTGTQGGDTIDARFRQNTTDPHDLNTVALRGSGGADQFLLYTSNQRGGVDPEGLVTSPVTSGVGTISLYGDAGNDIFGQTPDLSDLDDTGAMDVGLLVPATTRMIRPTIAATAGGSTIFIDGGDPVPLVNQVGDTVGDVLNLDVSGVPNNTAMIVGAGSSGNVLSANTAPFSWVSIEDINLVDNGKLTGVQIGDVFGRGTTGNDLMQISANATAALPHQVRVRIGGAIMNYNVPGKAVLYGGNGVDTMSQTTAKIPAVFYGEAGNDSLAGGSNNDWLVGGDGNDQITGGEGQNVIWGDNAPTNPGDPTPQDFQGANDGNDTISSGNGADVIYAGGGHDVVNSGGGNDYIHAGAGNDSVDAGAGDDRVYGYSGNDTLQGNTGNDLLSGGDGNDWLLGSAGNDVLIGGTGADTLNGGDGNDLLITGGLAGGAENSTWTSAPNTMTYAANTYSDPMDNDAALLALLTAWQGNSNAAAPPPEVLALLPIIAPDGSDDDAWGGNGSDLFSWDAADMADESLTAPGPNDFNNPATGPDVRLI
ncbi:autotransporter-associated beta strand repeat-containing protein [Anatilimnocola aggregata]|uniref:autotransporter-associated beta strand repeat-containing protein n=1 Tax=Anatilimnocola aggregata TaxID=2528021 RepID=UPI00192E31A0|nr:autotransporter-associated beta strand repeat-containing protein [Anatilimnocola aggregata]